jgi:hypothetical protein
VSPDNVEKNRCLVRWTAWIPRRGRRGRASRENSKKDLVTGLIRVFVPSTDPTNALA